MKSSVLFYSKLKIFPCTIFKQHVIYFPCPVCHTLFMLSCRSLLSSPSHDFFYSNHRSHESLKERSCCCLNSEYPFFASYDIINTTRSLCCCISLFEWHVMCSYVFCILAKISFLVVMIRKVFPLCGLNDKHRNNIPPLSVCLLLIPPPLPALSVCLFLQPQPPLLYLLHVIMTPLFSVS